MTDSTRGDAPTASAAAEASGTRLSGRWLFVARAGWLVLLTVTVIQFAASLPGYFDGIRHPSLDNGALTPGAVEALMRAGITLDAYAWVSTVIICIVVLASVALALLLFLRRGDDWMALLVSLFVVLSPIANIEAISTSAAVPTTLPEQVLNVALALPLNAVFYAPFLLFPTGRFVPRWSWVLLIAWTAWIIGFTSIPPPLGDVLAIGYPFFYGTAIACQVYRYRHTSTPVQRQQTKWVVAGLAAALLANQAFWLPTGFTPLGQTLYPLFAVLVYQLVLLAVPITFFIAIQRYRLYEIDTIINRALVYGSLTAVLVATYAVVVIGTQTLVGVLTHHIGAGTEQPVVIVATTLLIAALFRPLRTRLQALVDRRFYRSKYDAAKTVAAFSATLRQELDLAALHELLVAAVEETMQPEHVSLWLLTPAPQLQAGADKADAA